MRLPAVLLLLAFAGAAGAESVSCRPDEVILTRSDGQRIAAFHIEVADDEAERAHGLMARETLPRASGMLFIYPSERSVTFWMRDTLIPLDMLFADDAGRVVSVHSNARPHDETPIPSGAPVRFVLEINGGLARRMGISPGAVLSHPAIAPERAARPCR